MLLGLVEAPFHASQNLERRRHRYNRHLMQSEACEGSAAYSRLSFSDFEGSGIGFFGKFFCFESPRYPHRLRQSRTWETDKGWSEVSVGDDAVSHSQQILLCLRLDALLPVHMLERLERFDEVGNYIVEHRKSHRLSLSNLDVGVCLISAVSSGRRCGLRTRLSSRGRDLVHPAVAGRCCVSSCGVHTPNDIMLLS